MPASSFSRGRTSTPSFFLGLRANSSRRGVPGDHEQALTCPTTATRKKPNNLPKKSLRESREKGEVPRSRDLSGALVVLAGVAALMNSGESAFLHARQIFSLGLGYSREALFSDALPGRTLHAAMSEALEPVRAGGGGDDAGDPGRTAAAGRAEFQRAGAAAEVRAARPDQGAGQDFRDARPGRTGQGVAQADLHRHGAAAVAAPLAGRIAGHRPRLGDGRDRAVDRPARPRGAVVRLDAGADRWHRCAVPEVRPRQEPAHDQAGDQGRDEGERGQPRDEGAHPPGAAGAGAPTHDGGIAQGRRGGGQPDPLCRGAALRRRAHGRAAGDRQGRRRAGPADPPGGGPPSHPAGRGAAVGTRLVCND